MKNKVEYTNQAGKQKVLDLNKGKYLVEEQNLTEGNFLIFSDVPSLEDYVIQLASEIKLLRDVLASKGVVL